MQGLDKTGEILIASYEAEKINRLKLVSDEGEKVLFDFVGQTIRVALSHLPIGIYQGASDKPCILDQVDRQPEGRTMVRFTVLGNNREEQAKLIGKISADDFVEEIHYEGTKQNVDVGYHPVIRGYFKDYEGTKVQDSWDTGLQELLGEAGDK